MLTLLLKTGAENTEKQTRYAYLPGAWLVILLVSGQAHARACGVCV